MATAPLRGEKATAYKRSKGDSTGTSRGYWGHTQAVPATALTHKELSRLRAPEQHRHNLSYCHMAQGFCSPKLPWCSGMYPKPCGDKGKGAQQLGVAENYFSSFLSTGYGPSPAPSHSPFPHFQPHHCSCSAGQTGAQATLQRHRRGQSPAWALVAFWHPSLHTPCNALFCSPGEQQDTVLPPALQCLWPCSQHSSGTWLLSCKGFSRHLDRVMDGCINTCFV